MADGKLVGDGDLEAVTDLGKYCSEGLFGLEGFAEGLSSGAGVEAG